MASATDEQRRIPSEPPFDYASLPLPDPTTHIRLLQITDVKSNPLRCQLSVQPLSDLPPFEAISYTWGDPGQQTWLIVNEQRMAVRLNCAAALLQAQSCGQAGYLWIDALCINQKDGPEKSNQVNLMGHIYHAAVRTIACLSRQTEGWAELLSFLEANRALLQVLNEKMPRRRDFLELYIHSWNDIPLEVLSLFISWLSCNTSQTELQQICRSYDFMTEIMSQPYFERLWVLQELFCAKEVRFCCGNRYETGQALHGFILLIHVLESARQEFSQLTPLEEDMLQRPLPANDLAVLQMFDWSRIPTFESHNVWHPTFRFAIQDSSEKYSLLALFMRCGHYHQKCEDHRDLIYGLLNLVDWNALSGKVLFPDYSKSLVQVLTETYVLLVSYTARKWAKRVRSSGFEKVELEFLQAFSPAIKDVATQSRLSLLEPLPDGQPQLQYTLDYKTFRDWRSLRLVCIDDKWYFDTHDQQLLGDQKHPTTCANHDDAAKATPQQPYCGMLNRKGEPAIYFSRHTRSGDWLLIGKPSLPQGAVIARQCEADGTLHLISYVAFSDRYEYRTMAKNVSLYGHCVDMSFDVEDYVVYFVRCSVLSYASRYRSLGRGHYLLSSLPDFLDTHVCRFAGSSFAIWWPS